MKIKRIDLFNVRKGLEILKKRKGTEFQYFLIKNIKKMDSEIEIFKELIKDEKFEEYDKKRIELCVKYAKKDDNGNPIIINNSYSISAPEIFNKELQKLRIENMEIITEYEKKDKELLNTEIEIEYFKIKFDKLPSDLDGYEMELLTDFIE